MAIHPTTMRTSDLFEPLIFLKSDSVESLTHDAPNRFRYKLIYINRHGQTYYSNNSYMYRRLISLV
jgi:hypothetical protein